MKTWQIMNAAAAPKFNLKYTCFVATQSFVFVAQPLDLYLPNQNANCIYKS